MKLTLARDDPTIQRLASLVLELARYDLNYDLRDRSRFATALLGMAPTQALTVGTAVDEASLQALRMQAPQVMLAAKMPPLTLLGPVSVEGLTDLTIG